MRFTTRSFWLSALLNTFTHQYLSVRRTSACHHHLSVSNQAQDAFIAAWETTSANESIWTPTSQPAIRTRG